MTALTEVDYLVVDVETTGFSPRRGDRVVEAAVLRCRPGEGVVDRFTTLVNPERPMGATHVHRVRTDHVRSAPTFFRVAERLRRRLSGGVVVAHNLGFDLAFLDSEFERAGHPRLTGPTLCTMELASQLALPVAGRSLAACCRHFTIPLNEAHGAEHDAQATAQLLLCLLREARATGLRRLDDLTSTAHHEHVASSPIETTGPRFHEAGAPTRKSLRLSAAVRRVADTTPMGCAATAAYLSLVDSVLMDGVLTPAEANALTAKARRCSLDEDAVRQLHVEYLQQLADAAEHDGKLAPDDIESLNAVGTLLGVDLPRCAAASNGQES